MNLGVGMSDVLIAEGMALPAHSPFPNKENNSALLLPGTSYWGAMDKTAGRGSPFNGHLKGKRKNQICP